MGTFPGVATAFTECIGRKRPHLDVDSVELIEASPRSLLREAREETAHDLVVESVRTVENNAVHGQGLGQVLGCFRLAWRNTKPDNKSKWLLLVEVTLSNVFPPANSFPEHVAYVFLSCCLNIIMERAKQHAERLRLNSSETSIVMKRAKQHAERLRLNSYETPSP